MTRVSALWQASPSKIVGALFALALVAMMAVASGASFTSTSANGGNIVAAGVMSHDNSKADSAILDIHGLAPGDTAHGTVSLTNTGDVAGLFTLSKSNVVDSDPAHKLSTKLDLVVTDLTSGDEVYTGKLGAMPDRDAGTINPSQAHLYDFAVTWPDGGKPGSVTTGDNAYQGTNVTVDYAWESVSD